MPPASSSKKVVPVVYVHHSSFDDDLDKDDDEFEEELLSPTSSTPRDPPTMSIVQPGRQIPDTHISKELPGRIIKGQMKNQGGFADVYHGRWEQPDGTWIDVALKFLRSVSVESSKGAEAVRKRINIRLLREAVIWQSISHPNILTLHGVRPGTEETDPYLITAWCPNGDLKNYLAKHPSTTVLTKLQILLQAARAVLYLHGLSPPIVHGDIKPGNILITSSPTSSSASPQTTPTIAICDFGLSRTLTKEGASTGLTTSNIGQGSKPFQAPELLLEENKSSLKSDVYAFGGLILSVLSGKHPYYKIPSITTLIVSISKGATPKPEDHPLLPASDPLWGLMRRCWAREPGERPGMDVIVRELENEIARRS